MGILYIILRVFGTTFTVWLNITESTWRRCRTSVWRSSQNIAAKKKARFLGRKSQMLGWRECLGDKHILCFSIWDLQNHYPNFLITGVCFELNSMIGWMRRICPNGRYLRVTADVLSLANGIGAMIALWNCVKKLRMSHTCGWSGNRLERSTLIDSLKGYVALGLYLVRLSMPSTLTQAWLVLHP